MEQKSPAPSVSDAFLIFLIAGAFFAALSIATHSKIHTVSFIAHHGALLFGSIACISILPSWVYAMFFEVFALIAVLFIGLFQIRRWVEPAVGGPGTPILLIHGFCNDAGVWFYIRRKLAKVYSGPIYAISLKSAFHPLENHALTIKNRVAKILQETGSSKIILIGHSMGGLVASLYALEHAPQDAIQSIITIGTPFHGTYMAYPIPTQNARQMKYKSPFCEQLCKRLEQLNIPIHQIRSKTDEIIVPSTSCFLGRPNDQQFTVDDIGHAALLFSPRVANQLISWVSN